MTAVLCADYLYICHNYLEVCKLHNCSETLLVLSEISDAFDSSSALHLVVNPVKRFVQLLTVLILMICLQCVYVSLSHHISLFDVLSISMVNEE